MVIGICDDHKATRNLIEGYLKEVSDVNEIIMFENGQEVIRHLKDDCHLDLLYLDIDLRDDMDGMGVAAQIKAGQMEAGTAYNSLPLIIFVTGLPERMPDAFGVRAFQFLVKPIEKKQFQAIFRQAEREITNIKMSHHKESIMEVTVGGKVIRMEMSRITYIESSGRKLRIHYEGREIEYYGKMQDMIADIGPEFFQIHRSVIVNLAQIFSYDRRQVELKDGTMLPISKYQYKSFLDAYMDYGLKHF